MVSAVERREHIRVVSNDRSSSPIRGRHSPRRRTSPRRERSPAPRKRSPRGRSPDRTYRARSPVRENVPGRARSSKHERQRSPVKASPSRSPSPRTKRLRRVQGEREFEKSAKHERQRSPVKASASRSPSPRTKRLRRDQAEREFEKSADRDHGRSLGREDHDKGRHKERVEVKDVSRDRKSLRENNDGGSSKSSRHDHSDSPEGRSHKSRHSLRSPTRASKAGARNEVGTKAEPAEYSRDDENDALAKMKAAEQALEAKEKQKPSFELSGKLAEETNKVRGVTLLFNEPPDARKPEIRWRLYVFKAGEVLNEPLYVHRQSCYLFGRERKVADIPTDHPSCSKQHAVIQYRLVEKEQPDGMMSKEVRPYVMDLGSTNGTYINDNRIEPQRYYELFEKDTIRFGNSSREYVLLHEKSAG